MSNPDTEKGSPVAKAASENNIFLGGKV